MKKSKNFLLIIIPVIFILISFISFLVVTNIIKKDTYENLKYYINNSNIIKEYLGEVEDISIKGIGFERKYYKLNGNTTYIQCYLFTKDKGKQKVKVIFNTDVTGGVFAYEIDNKIYYEGITSTTDFIKIMYKSKALKEELGDIMYIYRPLNASYKKYDENKVFCNYIIIKNNNSAKKVNVIINLNNPNNIYAYETNEKLLYEEEIKE